MRFTNNLKTPCSFEIGTVLYSVSPGHDVEIPDHLAERLVKNGSLLTPEIPIDPARVIPPKARDPVESFTLSEKQAAEILDGATVEEALDIGVAMADIPPESDSDGTAAREVAKLVAAGVKLPGITDRRTPKGRNR